MSSSNEAEKSDFISAEVDAGQFRPARSRALVRGLSVIVIIMAVSAAVAAVMIQLRHNDLEAQLERRLEILSSGRAEVVAARLDGMAGPAGRIVDSELFRLFATEVDLAGDDLSDLVIGDPAVPEPMPDAGGLEAPLFEQLIYMGRVLSDFAQNAGYSAGYLINRGGIAYITSAGAPPMSTAQQEVALSVFASGRPVFGAARRSTGGVVVDVYSPIAAAQSESSSDQYLSDPSGTDRSRVAQPVGVLLLTAPVNELLIDALAPPPLAEPGEGLVLLQLSEDRLFRVDPNSSPPIRVVDGLQPPAAGQPIPFAERAGIGAPGRVYSAGSPVPGTAWWMLQEIDRAAAGTRMVGYVSAVVIVAVLIVVAVVAAFGAFWWRLANEHSSNLATQFKRLAARIEAQKRFLDGVNNSIAEYIGVKSKEGKYRYLNPAFAEAIRRDARDAVGLDDVAIFGRGTAERLERSDRLVLEEGKTVTFDSEVYLQSRLHHLQISKAPYQDDSGETAGVVSVMRDVTELVEERQRREKATHQMVVALVRAVELRDPYLAGHSRRVAGFARAVAEELGASREDIVTVEIAANLSQMGKLAVPVEILTKPGRLTEDEIAKLQGHVDHAAAILRDIDFGLPVLETVVQMHERLDGKGYPAGLSGGQIRLTGRILGACDVFCARVEPRTYRSGITPEAALDILEENGDRYDPQVVEALRRVVGSVTGEKLVADLGGL